MRAVRTTAQDLPGFLSRGDASRAPSHDPEMGHKKAPTRAEDAMGASAIMVWFAKHGRGGDRVKACSSY